MRGSDSHQSSLFSYVSLEDRIPRRHPLRRIRKIVDGALSSITDELAVMYPPIGRPSIPPERLLRALLLQVLYSVRSERQLVEQLEYNLLFRWFVGLSMDDKIWDATSFSKNRDRFLEGEIATSFFDAILEQASAKGLLSKEHFTVDGTLLEAWASHQSFRPKDDSNGPPSGDFRGKPRRNDTHESTTDPDSRLARKGPGKEAKLSYQGNVLTENRNTLIVGAEVVTAAGAAETNAALKMLDRVSGKRRVTVGADKAYDNRGFVEGARQRNATPHVIQSTKGRRSRIDARTTRHDGYAISINKRPLVEGPIGWLKQYGLMRRAMFRGLERMNWAFTFSAATFNALRLANLTAQA